MNAADIAARRILEARTGLVLDAPFFGALALRLDVVADPSCSTAWTDGQRLGYSPEFIASLSHAETVALLAHEVMHCAMGHPWRRSGRDARAWNIAADHAVNPLLVSAGFALPAGALDDPSFHGRSAEWIYDRLPAPEDGQDGDGGDGTGDGGDDGATGGTGPDGDPDGGDAGPDGPDGPGGDDSNPLGEVRDAPADSDGPTAEEWKQAAAQAAKAASARGSLPGGLDRFVKDGTRARVDWRSTLRRFVQERARADYSWSRPNPRHLARGLYLPALQSTEMGPLLVAVDTSGSVDDVALQQFTAELQAIVDDVDPVRVDVWYADTDVRRRETFERGDPLNLNAAGGGGTDFRPVFRELADLPDRPAAVIYLTDLDGPFPSDVPDVPVLWGATGPGRPRSVPFGDVVRVE